MKRFLSILFAIVLVLTLAVPAFADEAPASNPTNCSCCTCNACESSTPCQCTLQCPTPSTTLNTISTLISVLKHPGNSSTFTLNSTPYTSTWFSVQAIGVKSYIWQILYPNTDTWYDIPNADVTEEWTDGIILTIKLHLRTHEDIVAHAGCHYRCILIDECGNYIITNDAYIYDNTPVYTSTCQPCVPCYPCIPAQPCCPYNPCLPQPDCCYWQPSVNVVTTVTTVTTVS